VTTPAEPKYAPATKNAGKYAATRPMAIENFKESQDVGKWGAESDMRWPPNG
jgi:hypothetical protein